MSIIIENIKHISQFEDKASYNDIIKLLKERTHRIKVIWSLEVHIHIRRH